MAWTFYLSAWAAALGAVAAAPVGWWLAWRVPPWVLVLLALFPPGFVHPLVAPLPLTVAVCAFAFRRIGRRWHAVARALGDTPWQAFGRVDLPLAFPGVLGAAGFAFARAAVERGWDGVPAVVLGLVVGCALTLVHAQVMRACRLPLPVSPVPPYPTAWCPADVLDFPHLSVREQLGYAGAPRHEIDRVAETLGLTGVLDRRYRHLTPAERQLTAVGRAALAPGPLVLDDPVSLLSEEQVARVATLTSARTPSLSPSPAGSPPGSSAAGSSGTRSP